MNSELIILIGLPGSGKSYWRANFLTNNKDYEVASSDDIIDALCLKDNITYSEGFDKFIKQADKEFKEKVENFFKTKNNFIIDRTNMSEKSRKDYLNKAKLNNYKVRAVVFSVSDAILNDRLKKREGKNIPSYVISTMKKSYQRPSLDEGFTNIEYVNFL